MSSIRTIIAPFVFVALLSLLLLPASAFAAPFERILFSAGDGDGAIGATTECIEVTNDTSADPGASAFPRRYRLGVAYFQLNTIAGGAASLTSYWALDSGGDYAITPSSTDTIVTGATTATDGSVTVAFDYEPAIPNFDVMTPGSLWACVALDAGTANIDWAIATWTERR
jgi:hypothetical protein